MNKLGASSLVWTGATIRSSAWEINQPWWLIWMVPVFGVTWPIVLLRGMANTFAPLPRVHGQLPVFLENPAKGKNQGTHMGCVEIGQGPST